jgi:hypothetical protein
MAGLDDLLRMLGTEAYRRMPYVASAARQIIPSSFQGPGLTLSRRGVPGARPAGTFRPPLAEARNYKAGGAGLMGAMKQPADPLMMLYEQLIEQLQQPAGYSPEDLMAQVRAQIDPIYNARRAEAEARTERGRGEVKNMYRALANDYERLAPEQAAQAQAAQEEVEAIYGQLRTDIEGNYSRVAEEQTELFEQLGIEAAAPDVLNPQSEQAVAAMNAASELEAINEQRYEDIGNIDETYWREGSPLATLTGTNVSRDMLFDLNQYVNQLEAERSSGIQTAYSDLLSQAMNQASSENSRRQQMLFEILQSQLSARQGAQQQELNPSTFMASLPPQIQASVGSAFNSLQRSPEAVYGKVEDPRHPVPGTFVETTPQWFLAQADAMLQSGQIDPATHQALLMFIQLQYGMGG